MTFWERIEPVFIVLIPLMIYLPVYIAMRIRHKKEMEENEIKWRNMDQFDR